VRVLIIDDEVRIRVSLARVLTKRGFTMDQAATAAEARVLLAERSYDAVLLDWQLPDGNGIDLCLWIRARCPAAHILMLTGRDDRIDRLRAFDAGVDDYVLKLDIDIEEIGARLRAAARRRQPTVTVPAKSA
jgi:two-component system, OmpR family, response regulator